MAKYTLPSSVHYIIPGQANDQLRTATYSLYGAFFKLLHPFCIFLLVGCLWVFSHIRKSSVSSRGKWKQQRMVYFACLSFWCSNLTRCITYRIVIIASVRSAIVGLCSFAKILLDFALSHVSFVLPVSGICQIMFLKSFLLFNITLLCKTFPGP